MSYNSEYDNGYKVTGTSQPVNNFYNRPQNPTTPQQNPTSQNSTYYKSPAYQYQQTTQNAYTTQPKENPYRATGSAPLYQTPLYESPIAPPKKGKKAKKNAPLKGIAFFLSCVAFGGAAGVGGAYLYTEHHTVAPQILYAAPPLDAEKVVTYSSKNVALPELYVQNVNSCVGIKVSTTTVNIFGQTSSAAASGSGFVVTSDGYIVTNYHVVEDGINNSSTPIEVNFVNGDSFEAKIVGYEKDNDLAVLKIAASGLQPVVMGDSDALVVGETLVAIGNPLGELDFTFTDGIVSAKDRLISIGDGVTMNMLQTNTAINPGNSGGPLFDGQGCLIGINTAKYATSSDGTSVEGLGFAIPINDVKEMIADIIENGYVTGKPYLGVTVGNVPDDAQQYGVAAGAAVLGVAEGSAAWNAGLCVGDIITGIGDKPVDTYAALTAAMGDYKAGDRALFTVVRQSESLGFAELQFTVVFDEKNEITEANNSTYEQAMENYNNTYGGNSNNSGNSNSSGSNSPFDRYYP